MAMIVVVLAASSTPRAAADKPRPIVDTHIHFYRITRPGGVPWPPPTNKVLYRDVLPAEYKALAKRYGIISSGIV